MQFRRNDMRRCNRANTTTLRVNSEGHFRGEFYVMSFSLVALKGVRNKDVVICLLFFLSKMLAESFLFRIFAN